MVGGEIFINKIMKYIITEEQHKKIFFLRRLPEFEKNLKKIVKNDEPCYYSDADEYAMVMIGDAILETFELSWDDSNFLDDFELMEPIKEKYYQKLVDKFNKECDEE